MMDFTSRVEMQSIDGAVSSHLQEDDMKDNKDNQQIAAEIDLRVRQLSVQNLSDSALIEQMFGYAASLQRLWTSTTDDELVALCRQYPGFVRYATLMENLSETMRTGVGVPAHIKDMAPLPEALRQAMIKLMSDGAELERGLQQRIEAGRASPPVVREVLATMVEAQDYVFFTVNAGGSGAATCFRSELGVAGVAGNRGRILRS